MNILPDSGKRRWNHGDLELTYEEWRQQEKTRDTRFVEYRKTAEGASNVAEVISTFPGLTKTSLGAEDASWFLREMATPGSYLRTVCQRAHQNAGIRPPLSDYQLVALALLQSPTRSVRLYDIETLIQELFPFFREEKDWWFPGDTLRARLQKMLRSRQLMYDCLFPHTGHMLDSLVGWSSGDRTNESRFPHNGSMEGNVSGWRICERYSGEAVTLPPGEENRIMTDRYRHGQILHHDAPPPSRVAEKGFCQLPDEILVKILNNVCKFDGVIYMPVLPKTSSSLRHEFRASILIPQNRRALKQYSRDYKKWRGLAPAALSSILDLRLVDRRWNRIARESFFSNVLFFPCLRTNAHRDSPDRMACRYRTRPG